MPDRPKTDRLVALLRAQRREAADRSHMTRGSEAWQASSDRLDDLNERIMRPEATTTRDDSLGMGLELDLDSRPIDDGPFRSTVIASLRDAVAAAARDRLVASALERIASSQEPIRLAREMVQAAESRLRRDYPDATVSALAVADKPATLIVRADRRGRVA